MKIYSKFILFIILITFFCGQNLLAQNIRNFSFSLAAGMSKTGSLKYGTSYRAFENSSTVHLLKTNSSQNKNFNFGIGYHPSKFFSINGSIGVASFGFQYTGDVTASPSNFASLGGFTSKESYSSRVMEVGLSANYIIKHNESISLFIQPGIAWYTNQARVFSPILFIPLNSNNFSATVFAGVEIPMISNILFINVGINSKIALNNFAAFYDHDNQFYPYAIGLQTTISYRFPVK